MSEEKPQNSSDLSNLVTEFQALIATKDWDAAEILLSKARKTSGGGFKVSFLTARLRFIQKRYLDAVSVIDTSWPDSASVPPAGGILKARCLIALGQLAMAGDMLDQASASGAKPDIIEKTRLALYLLSGKEDAAGKILSSSEQATRLLGDAVKELNSLGMLAKAKRTVAALRDHVSDGYDATIIAALFHGAGCVRSAEMFMSRGVTVDRINLPETLGQAMQELWGKIDRAPITDVAFKWARTLARQAGRDDPDWERKAKWGFMVRSLWYFPGYRAEIFELIEPPDWTPVQKYIDNRQGVLLVSTHVGVTRSIGMSIENSGLPYIIVASSTRAAQNPDHWVRVGQGRNKTARAMCRALQSGSLAVTAIDGRHSKNLAPFFFHRQRFELNSVMASFAFKHDIPVFWITGQWHGDRIRMVLKEVPAPHEGETSDQWQKRYLEFIMENTVETIVSDPRNMNGVGGIWRFVKQPR